jgi:hypothetical protein
MCTSRPDASSISQTPKLVQEARMRVQSVITSSTFIVCNSKISEKSVGKLVTPKLLLQIVVSHLIGADIMHLVNIDILG